MIVERCLLEIDIQLDALTAMKKASTEFFLRLGVETGTPKQEGQVARK